MEHWPNVEGYIPLWWGMKWTPIWSPLIRPLSGWVLEQRPLPLWPECSLFSGSHIRTTIDVMDTLTLRPLIIPPIYLAPRHREAMEILSLLNQKSCHKSLYKYLNIPLLWRTLHNTVMKEEERLWNWLKKIQECVDNRGKNECSWRLY